MSMTMVLPQPTPPYIYRPLGAVAPPAPTLVTVPLGAAAFVFFFGAEEKKEEKNPEDSS